MATAANAADRQTPASLVWREGGYWVLQARFADRAAVAEALAAASGSQLLEQPHALAAARPLTRHWRGRDLAEAWRQVLGDEVSHALQCHAGRCRVWVLAASAAVARVPGRATVLASAPETDTEAPSHAGSSVREPDPPGLFPSD